MAGRWIETHDSRGLTRTLDTATAERSYKGTQFNNVDQAHQSLLSQTPLSIYVDGTQCVRTNVEIKEVSSDPDITIFDGKISWETPNLGGGGGGGGGGDQPETAPEKDPEQPNDPAKRSLEFVTRSKVQIQAYDQRGYSITNNGNTAVKNDPKGKMINLHSDDLVPEGVEINDEGCVFNISKVFSESLVTNEWLKARLNQQWTLNASPFLGFNSQSVAMTGMSAERQTSGNWLINFKFEYKQDQSSSSELVVHTGRDSKVTIDGRVDGWRYIWYSYNTVKSQDADEAGGNKKVVRTIDTVNIARVYSTSDFSLLGDLDSV